MFEGVEVLAARLLAADPDQHNPCEPVLDTDDGALVDELVTLQRVIAAGQARTMVILAGLCRRAETWQDIHDRNHETRVGPEDLVAAEIAPALRLTSVTASIQVQRAVRIVTRLPGTLAAFATGGLDLGRVLAIDEAISVLSAAHTSAVEARVLPRAVDQNAAELRAALRKAVIAVDPDAAEKRRKRAIKDRAVTRYTDTDGTSVLRAVLSTVDTGEIYDLIDQMARRTKTSDDTRSMDARRADMFVWAILGRDPHLGPEDDEPPPAPPTEPTPAESTPTGPRAPDQPTHDGNPAHGVPTDRTNAPEPADGVVPAGAAGEADRFGPDPDDPGPGEPTEPEQDAPDPAEDVINTGWRDRQLARLDRISELAALALSAMTSRRQPRLPWVTINQTTQPDGSTVFVGELQGYGPITSQFAEHLLATGAARPPDQPSGRTPTPTQARTHDPPGWLDREVRDRDGTCRFPSCRQPAHRVDLDHVIPFPSGFTVRANLGGLCRRHHRIKGSGCWRVTQHDDGVYEWTSTITGRTYTTYPRGTTGDWRGIDLAP